MRYRILFIFLILCYEVFPQSTLPPVGSWREHLPYHQAIDIISIDQTLTVATPYSLFRLNTVNNNMERLSSVSGLSSTGIRKIAANNSGQKILVAYDNSFLDILYRNGIIPIPDLYRDNTTGDKTIYSVLGDDNQFYLSTGIGIIIIDAEKFEISQTWIIGNAGNSTRVNDLAIANGFYYAATNEGLKRIAISGSNPADYVNWEILSGVNGLPAGPVDEVEVVNGKVVTRLSSAVWRLEPSGWVNSFSTASSIRSINSSSSLLFIAFSDGTTNGSVVTMDENGSITKQFTQPGLIIDPRKTITLNGNTWITDAVSGLLKHDGITYQAFIPNSPAGIATGDLIFNDGKLIAASGETLSNGNGAGNYNGIYQFENGSWENINRTRFSILDSLPDFVTVAIDKSDKSIWAGSLGGGLLHRMESGTLSIIKHGFIAPSIFDPGSWRVTGLAFDQQSVLWVANAGAAAPLMYHTKDGNWNAIPVPFMLPKNALSKIVVDDNNFKWIIADLSGGLICFDDGASPSNTGDDRWRLFSAGAGQGNLPHAEVLSLSKDKSGFIWVGTRNGMAVIQCPSEIFSSTSCEAVWPIIQQGNFAGYLFQGEEVRSIAVDGADRKWVATANGAWLISASGESVIYRFTEDNSPLPSNDVRQIAIDGQTGEVYFATSKGIVSFRSTATEGTDRNQSLLIFPNPVPPGYTGTIAVRGVANNAIVKITEMDGRLVWQGRALGGQAVWDGRDYNGRKIQTGVYLVLINDDSRKEKAAGKIVFINK